MKKTILAILVIAFIFCRCSLSKQIGRTATKTVIESEAFKTAHVGISIYEPATNRYWYNYQGDHYFVPASNVKIPTCYAAMKYLGDSIVGLRYGIPEEKGLHENAIVIQPTGDPTFLHRNYLCQPIFDFLKENLVTKHKNPGLLINPDNLERWGAGWSWDDYQESYMAERSSFPVFGNTISVSLYDTTNRFIENPWVVNRKVPKLFNTGIFYFDSLLNKAYVPIAQEELKKLYPKLRIIRELNANTFQIRKSELPFTSNEIPFVTNDFSTALQLLADTFKTQISFVGSSGKAGEYDWESDDGDIAIFHINRWNTIYSRPVDSVLQPMLYNSDNFFAEQSLLMVSNEVLGVMNDEKIIDTLLKTDFKGLPQKPRWVDGSGLSRYNLFTPQDLVAILNKMKIAFGMERLQRLFPTGGSGTFQNYFVQDSGYFFAKTGSMSGVNCLSGFLYTRKNKLLLFSVLVNNQQAPATVVRHTVEAFLEDVRKRF